MKAAHECGLCGQLVYEHEWVEQSQQCTRCADPINPPYYRRNGMELIDVLKAWGMVEDGLLMQAAQYVFRANFKGHRKEDLEKAIWYIQEAIKYGEVKK